MTAAAATKTGDQPDDMRSHHVKPQEMPWDKMRFPGCECKTLLFDPKTGMATVYMRMQPGATLPDHEHVLVEQTYVLSGSLVDKEGPDAGLEVKAGEFVWRPSGSRHVAWCPNGGEMIAIFQVPNKFFDQPGRITDAGGKDWDQSWKHVLSQ